MLKTAVALSGGADSLMTLLLLRESGAAVMGVHALFLEHPEPALHQQLQALCTEFDVPFELIDLRREFEQLVIEPFVRAYQSGLTPNPCAACNPGIKFGLLQDRVRECGAQRLATGHYARLEPAPYGPALFRGLDPAKDQSYFLSMVPRARFEGVVFPLARMTKAEVLAELRARGLTPPAGKESQEVCFIPEDYRGFLRSRGAKLSGPGAITLADGTVLGRHTGLWNHTLGQRKGLGIAYSEPLYVTGKDFRQNRLIVGPKSETLAAGCRTGEPNLLCPHEHWPAEVLVQTIYRQRPEPALVTVDESGMTITFTAPRPLPTPGQVAAVYSAEGQILAGAIIREELHAA